ncbi:MAG: MobP3 family relaxase [Eubacteriales bacterium]|nr:MobP3 family relaxase [Eubacteriales bacterium]
MARIILKSPYLKPNAKVHIENYVRYIATREGAEPAKESSNTMPAFETQQKLIKKLLKAYPDSKDLFEYEDYLKEPTRKNADELIMRIAEMHSELLGDREKYVKYIAERPRVEKLSSHGLFTDDGVPIILSDVAKEVAESESNIWTHIISLRREDAERLGYNSADTWMNLIRANRNMIARNMKIAPENFRWYAAFHNESHHPHIHMMAYSTDPGEAYLTKNGIREIKATLAKEIFRQDLLSIYEKQTEHRDALRANSREVIAEIISKINNGVYDNPKLEEMLLRLADRLSKTSGKKVYGYLKADVKAIIDSIVDELAADERIAALYELWYEKREEVIRTYTDELPERVPLSQNKEFKSIKNAVIQEAMNIIADRTPIEDAEEQPAPTLEPSDAETETPMTDKEKKSLMWRYYSQAKDLLDKDSEFYDPNTAVEFLIESAKLGCGVAKYRLGKMFLRGDEVAKNVDYALRWLEESVDEHNQYAEYLLGKTYLKGEDVEQDLSRAEDLLRRSSAQGNRYAKYTLGKNLFDGEIFLQNIPEADKLLTESSDKGFAPAQYFLGKLLYKGEVIPQDLERAIDYLERAAGQKNPYAAYLAGKLRLTEDEVKDIRKAIRNFEIAAENGNDYAEYQLGKIYLYGREVDRDYEKAMAYLTSAAERGNQYAAQLLHSIKSNRNWSAALGSLRLLGQISRAIQNRLEDERKGKMGAIDRKLKRIIDEKKQAHGLRQG